VGASQEIYRAIERFRAEGKPVVVSMGNVAASGGYYVSAPADYIMEKIGVRATVGEAYEQFLKAILKYRGKKISEEKLREVADGRVLTGERAKDLGLVDELGGIEDAVEKAKELAGVPRAREFFVPEEKSLLQRVLGGEIEELKVLNSYSPLFYLQLLQCRQ